MQLINRHPRVDETRPLELPFVIQGYPDRTVGEEGGILAVDVMRFVIMPAANAKNCHLVIVLILYRNLHVSLCSFLSGTAFVM